MPLIKDLKDFKTVYTDRFNHLVIYSVGMGVAIDAAKDITQECFIRLWENRKNVENPAAYLFRSVRNGSINYIKRNKSSDISDMDFSSEEEESLDDILEHFRKLEEIYRKVNDLPGKCKEVYNLVYYKKMKIAEVASCLNISENTVKTYLKRGKEIINNPTVIILIINISKFLSPVFDFDCLL